jgi:hypothetical protein
MKIPDNGFFYILSQELSPHIDYFGRIDGLYEDGSFEIMPRIFLFRD